MKLNLDELITKLNEGAKIEDLGIEVKKRLPIIEKMYLIEGYKTDDIDYKGLAEECTKIVNGMKIIHYGLKEIMTVSTIVNNYSNIDCSSEYFYDKLMDSGLYSYVIELIDKDDLWQFTDLLENNIEQNLKVFNSPVFVLNRLVTELIKKIPDEKSMAKIVKEIKNIDSKKMAELKKMASKLVM